MYEYIDPQSLLKRHTEFQPKSLQIAPNLRKIKVLSDNMIYFLFASKLWPCERIICFVYHNTKLLMEPSVGTAL